MAAGGTAVRLEPDHPASGKGGDQAPLPQPPLRSVYSVFVTWMKLLLPALACALVILVVAWPQIVPDDSGFKLEAISDIAQQAETLSMLNARYTGFDEERRPFTITADVASQEPGDDEKINLVLPKADITLTGGEWLAVTADRGLYERTKQQLHLEGNVNLFHDNGFEMRSEEANVDLQEGKAWGDLPVEGQGPAGTIKSRGFRVYDRGSRIFFTGQSHMLLYPGSEDGLQ